MVEFEHVADMQTHEKSSLDIFETSIRMNEPTKEVVNKELQMFKKFQVDVKDIKCPLEWWVNHRSLFPTITFLTCQIFGIVGYQIKIKNFFSLA
jgi:phage terminase large subunit